MVFVGGCISMEGNMSWIARSTIGNISRKNGGKDCEIRLGQWGTNTAGYYGERNGHVCSQCLMLLHNFLSVFGCWLEFLHCAAWWGFFLWLCWNLFFLCHHLTSVTREFWPDFYVQCVITVCPGPGRSADFWLATHCVYMFCYQRFGRIW